MDFKKKKGTSKKSHAKSSLKVLVTHFEFAPTVVLMMAISRASVLTTADTRHESEGKTRL